MGDYRAVLLRGEDYRTSQWSGGTTTELGIAPEGSVYADRDFLWRLSSATVDLEESTFTSLPDYNRLIMTLKGGIRLAHNGGEWIELPEFTVHAFDGGDDTVSLGKVVDFNLMMRKGKCTGAVVPFQTAQTTEGTVKELLGQDLQNYETVLLYCWEGSLKISLEDGESFELQKGESLRMDGSFTGASWSYRAGAGTSFVLAAAHIF